MIMFNKYMAIDYGINAAIVANYLWDLIWDKRKDPDLAFNYGCRWVRYSMRKIALELGCLSLDMVKNAIKTLTDEGIIKKENFNESKFDHTNWYAFTEYGDHVMRRGEWDG